MTAGLSEQLELSVLPECDRRMFCLINFVFFEISFKTTTQFVFDNSIPLQKYYGLRISYYGLRHGISEYRACRPALCALAAWQRMSPECC